MSRRPTHPLRRMLSYEQVLVCEGASDKAIIDTVWGGLSASLRLPQVFFADGSKNTKPLRAVLRPAYSIRDRDFELSTESAGETLRNRKPHSFWPRHDIECYLLYPDWMTGALVRLEHSPQQIEAGIAAAAAAMVAYHAGRRSVALLNARIGPQHKYVVKNASLDAADAWQEHLQTEAANIIAVGGALAEHDALSPDGVMQLFEQQMTFYADCAQNLDCIRREFSGKRIFQELARAWDVQGRKKPGKAKKKGWELLRQITLEVCGEYSRSLDSLDKLVNDPRLGDFGLLAEKVTTN